MIMVNKNESLNIAGDVDMDSFAKYTFLSIKNTRTFV